MYIFIKIFFLFINHYIYKKLYYNITISIKVINIIIIILYIFIKIKVYNSIKFSN